MCVTWSGGKERCLVLHGHRLQTCFYFPVRELIFRLIHYLNDRKIYTSTVCPQRIVTSAMAYTKPLGKSQSKYLSDLHCLPAGRPTDHGCQMTPSLCGCRGVTGAGTKFRMKHHPHEYDRCHAVQLCHSR